MSDTCKCGHSREEHHQGILSSECFIDGCRCTYFERKRDDDDDVSVSSTTNPTAPVPSFATADADEPAVTTEPAADTGNADTFAPGGGDSGGAGASDTF